MPPEIVALIAKPHLLAVILAVGAVAGVMAEQAMSRLRRRGFKKGRKPWTKRGDSGPRVVHERPHESPKPPDAADQLRIVMGADFTIQPLLNRSEARLFKELDRLVLGCNPGWQVMAQVSLGEVLSTKDARAYGCINSKRVDLLLVDGDCQPRHAIEYQGAGHHQGTAAARDAIKREALRRAGIGYHEVLAGTTTPMDLRRLVERLVDKP